MMSLRMMMMANGVKPVEDDFVILAAADQGSGTVVYSHVLAGNTVIPKAQVTETSTVRALSPYNPLNSFLRGNTLHTAPKGAIDAGVVMPYSAPGIEFDGTTIKQLRLASTDATSWHFERLTFDLTGNKTNTETFTITPARGPTRSRLYFAANSASYTVHDVAGGGATVWNKDAAVVQSPLAAALGHISYSALSGTFWIAHNRMYAPGGTGRKKYIACWDIDDPDYPSYAYQLPDNHNDAFIFVDMDGYIWVYLAHQVDAKLHKLVKFDQWLRPVAEYFGAIRTSSSLVSIGHAPKTVDLPPLPPIPKTGVTSLLHFDNSPADVKTITDETGRVWGAKGDAQVLPLQKKFGKSSLELEGAGYITTDHHAGISLAGGDFTIQGWLRIKAFSTTDMYFVDKDGKAGVSLSSYALGVTPAGQIKGYVGNGTSAAPAPTIFTGTTRMATARWYHFAMTKEGTTLRIFIDGNLEASGTAGAMTDGHKPLLIGWSEGQLASFHFNGNIDEVRINKGTAEYTANFTPPTAPFTYP